MINMASTDPANQLLQCLRKEFPESIEGVLSIYRYLYKI